MPTIRLSGAPLARRAHEPRHADSQRFGLTLRDEIEVTESRRGFGPSLAIPVQENDVFELTYSDGLVDFRTTSQLREAAGATMAEVRSAVGLPFTGSGGAL